MDRFTGPSDSLSGLTSRTIVKPLLLLLYVLVLLGDGVRLLGVVIVTLLRSFVHRMRRRGRTISWFPPPKTSLAIRFLAFRLRWKSVFFLIGSQIHTIIESIAKRLTDIVAMFRKQVSAARFPKIRRRTALFYPHAIRLSDQLKLFFLGVFVTILFVAMPLAATVWVRTIPNPQLLSKRAIEVTTKIYDRHGELLYEIFADQNRTPIPLSDIPLHLKYATLAIEDKDFYRHPGFSIRAITRALRETLFNHTIQGGSTITQQLVRSALLTPEIKLTRKIKEIFLAFWAEQLYTKDEILEMYFNQVPYGGTSWGVEAASQTYFGTSAKNVSLAQAALLAGLPAAPGAYSPYGATPQKSFERQREVLRRMVEDGYISQEQAEEAAREPIILRAPGNSIKAPHFVMYVRGLLEDKYGMRLVERGGLRIVTSLDGTTQEKTQAIVSAHIEKLTNLRVGNGAALVTNPQTGEILAMVGSNDYFDVVNDGNVNVTTALRPPGSAIKVLTYALALENGFTAATILDDSPVVYTFPGSPSYAPVNYDGKFHGLVPLRYALGNSYNVPAVKTLAKLGVDALLDKASLVGITSWSQRERYGLSLTLGGGELTMLEMARLYGTIANLGKSVPLQPILEITDYTGRVIEKNTQGPGTQAIAPEVAWIVGNILSDNTARMSAFGPNSTLVIPGKTVSVKTGTSNDKRDNWTIGFTPSLVVAVWVGNNDNSPMHPTLSSGITGAAPIWHDITTELLKDRPDEAPPVPDGVVAVPCFFGRTEYFIKGTQPPGGRCAPLPTPTPSPPPLPRQQD